MLLLIKAGSIGTGLFLHPTKDGSRPRQVAIPDATIILKRIVVRCGGIRLAGHRIANITKRIQKTNAPLQ